MPKGGFNWKGAQVVRRVQAAAVAGVNETLGECVSEAKANHPGWVNRTTNAEGSIRVVQFAALAGAQIVGRWGSEGVAYMVYLEYLHGSALRSAADALYPTLATRIKRRIK